MLALTRLLIGLSPPVRGSVSLMRYAGWLAAARFPVPADDMFALACKASQMDHPCSNGSMRKIGVGLIYHFMVLADIRPPVWYQDRVVQLVKTSINQLGTVQGRELTRRPQHVTWFVAQLSMYVCSFFSSSTPWVVLMGRCTRCLLLWNHDRSLKNALILGKALLYVIDVLNSLWPCYC